MRPLQVWKDTIVGKDKNPQCIYDLAFRPDGAQLVVTAGNRVLVYETTEGGVVQSLKGHRDTVYCVSYAWDGQHFASGGADRTVIIWNQRLEGELKYTHADAILSLAFSPISQQLLSCTAAEIGLWSPEQKSVGKHKVASKVCCCGWTNDGQYFAIGLFSGLVTVWTKSGEEKVKIERPGGLPVYSLSWNPSKADPYDVLTLCDWGQNLSYYQLNGRQIGKDRSLGYDPCCLSYFPSGDYAAIGGSNKKVSLYSKEGVLLTMIGDLQSWVWCCKFKPVANHNFVAVGCQDGTIIYYQISFNTVHGLYKDRYAYRERMTEVIVQHLTTDDTIKIRCRDLVKKIAVYRNRLAVQLPEKIIIYELTTDDQTDMNYQIKEKINQKFECSLLVVCSQNLVICQEKRLQCFNLAGEKEREWQVDSQIRYIKVIGGPIGREALLVGLKSGQVLKIFVDNPFPIHIFKQKSAVRCLDISASRAKLAVVDESGTLLVYDITTKEVLFQEPNAGSVAWNTHYEDMLCFSGGGMLKIKASKFPVHQQRQLGFVVGFSASKIFCLHFFTMATIDVPQSASMMQCLERKLFREAYRIACLGVTEGDWRVLAMEALEGMDLDTAKKAFIRVRDLRFLELIHNLEERRKRGETDKQVFLADIFTYQGKFHEAAQLYRKANQEERAVEMFTDLRQFELAKEFLSSSQQLNVKELISKQADWAKTTNDPQAACDMYTAAGEYMEALAIMEEHGWTDRVLSVVHDVDKSQTEILQKCAHCLKKLGQFAYAADVLEKLEDHRALIALLTETQQWENAFEIVEKYPQYKGDVYVPYATWLVESDRFDEAQEALNKAGRQSEAVQLLQQLAENATKECRYDDAGYYYWLLAKSSIEAGRRAIQDGSSEAVEEQLSNFHRFMDLAETYYVYFNIHRYIEQPFTSQMAEALFNMARFLMHKLVKISPDGISKFMVLLTIAKQSRQLGANKLARQVFGRLQGLRVPPQFQETVDLGSLTARSKPFLDKEELLPMCYRCSTSNPLLSTAGNECTNCRQPFEHSFVSFDVLPVVEFVLEEGISDEEALRLIQMEPRRRKHTGAQWRETQQGNTQTLVLDDGAPDPAEGDEDDPFTSSSYEASSEFSPVRVGRAALESLHHTEVLVKRWSPPLHCQFFKSLMPDVAISLCHSCNKMFHSDNYEVHTLRKGHCPFCRKLIEST